MFLLDYIIWHYTEAPAGILNLLRNYTIGTWHKFLIAQHFKTLFAPWHRAQPSDVGSNGEFGEVASKVVDAVVNFYIRLVAAFMRFLIIVFGLLDEAAIFIIFLIVITAWILWPFILLTSFIKGLLFIIS